MKRPGLTELYVTLAAPVGALIVSTGLGLVVGLGSLGWTLYRWGS